MKLYRVIWTVFFILFLSCSEGPVFLDQLRGSEEKELAAFDSNINQIISIQEKAIANFTNDKNFLSIKANPTEETNSNGFATYTVNYILGTQKEEVQWSSNVVEIVPFEYSFLVEGEIVTIRARQLIATPYGLNYNYGERFDYVFSCVEFPKNRVFDEYVSCGMIFKELYLFSSIMEEKNFDSGVVTTEFIFSKVSFSLVINLSENDSRYYPDIGTGSGQIIKYHN